MQTQISAAISRFVAPKYTKAIKEKIEALPKDNLNEFGVDPFGFDPNTIKQIAPAALWLYKNYFRCETFGAENITNKRMLVVANHSGQIPIDGMMIETAFLMDSPRPRLLRGMAERWSAELPFISTLFVRGGQIVGIPSACKKLLEMDEAVIVFPEGVRGISKLFKDRYKLKDFGTGFMRLAIETKTPILPVALVGAEEQAPAVANLTRIAKMFSLPALPLILPQVVPLPLPVKYRIHIGKPMHFNRGHSTDEDYVYKSVSKVQNKIQVMLNKGRESRRSIFF